MKKIIFFYPSHVLGGAEILFARLSEYIVDIYEVIIVDYENGIYSKLITNPKVKLIAMSIDKIVINGDAIIID